MGRRELDEVLSWGSGVGGCVFIEKATSEFLFLGFLGLVVVEDDGVCKGGCFFSGGALCFLLFGYVYECIGHGPGTYLFIY